MPQAAHDAPGAASMFDGFFQSPLAAAINHVLKSASWARQRLMPHAGRCLHVSVAPFFAALTILESGNVANATRGDTANVRITLTAGTALHMLASGTDAWQDAHVEGDTMLARDILYLAQNLRWDVEEDLSRVFGDIAAHRMVRFGNEIRRWKNTTADNLAHSAAAYWTEEQPLIAARDDVQRYLREVDVLRDDVARTEKRLENLVNRHAAT